MEKQIKEIPITQINPFPNHPFKVKDDEDMMNLVESIAFYRQYNDGLTGKL